MGFMTIVSVVETPEFQRRARSLMSEAERLALIDFGRVIRQRVSQSGAGSGSFGLPERVAARAAAFA
jgi:hypothetical protein